MSVQRRWTFKAVFVMDALRYLITLGLSTRGNINLAEYVIMHGTFMRDHLRHAACTDNKNVFFIKLGLTYVQ
jgi:hypothetical protein